MAGRRRGLGGAAWEPRDMCVYIYIYMYTTSQKYNTYTEVEYIWNECIKQISVKQGLSACAGMLELPVAW